MKRLNFRQKETIICPGEKDQVIFWTKKWGITTAQLNEAIIETGSLNIKEIKNYFSEKGFVFSFFISLNSIKYFLLKKQLSYPKSLFKNVSERSRKSDKVVWLRMVN